MKLEYRPAQDSDIETIYTFYKDLIDRYEDVENIDYEKVLLWGRRKISGGISDYRCIFADGQKAGYYCFQEYYEDKSCMEIDDLYLFPEYRGKGIGTAVLQKCCRESTVPVVLYVFKKNRRAVSLYRKLGFEITAEAGGTRYIMKYTPDAGYSSAG